MSGTIAGGRRAAQTNKELYGEDFYKNIGAMGGRATYHGKKGFASMDKDKVAEAGRKGGSVSRRGSWSKAERAERLGVKTSSVKVVVANPPRYIKTSLWKSIKGRIKV